MKPLVLLMAVAAAAFGQAKKRPEEPLALFSGVVRGNSSRSLTIEDPEGNTVLFDCSGKTRYYDGKKAVKASALKAGDKVSVEARRTLVQRLEAVNVRREPPRASAP